MAFPIFMAEGSFAKGCGGENVMNVKHSIEKIVLNNIAPEGLKRTRLRLVNLLNYLAEIFTYRSGDVMYCIINSSSCCSAQYCKQLYLYKRS